MQQVVKSQRRLPDGLINCMTPPLTHALAEGRSSFERRGTGPAELRQFPHQSPSLPRHTRLVPRRFTLPKSRRNQEILPQAILGGMSPVSLAKRIFLHSVTDYFQL